ncbi:tetratricopeptide repeat protein [Hyalangium rubrum]|uniref:Tetratricopeptide repeat protein n=1 Tax=Hyalangium rubrum TaxID=3103134 RepID=A0ABU5HEB5_9BACT|nr:tetratricopeptide repeat protein [Hyalangium sp. s54d21]MDY7231148.1 tetratricopeptide repeat protein [Hyalangium sp. s54d21]
MANPEKMTQRELKQPDAFQRVGEDAREWLIERQSAVLTIVVLLLIGGAIAAVVSYFSDKGEVEAAKQLGLALEPLERPVVPPVEGVQPTPPPGEKPPYESVRKQDEALEEALNKFRTDHAKTQSATTAALPLGKAQYRLGKHAEAIASFDAFLQGAADKDPLRADALEGRGYAYEAQQKYDEALKAFEDMSKASVGGYLAGMGEYHRARILIAQGKKEEAAGLLVKIPVDHANSAAARLSTERTALLAAEGVKIPAPPAPPSATGQDGGA